MKSAVIILAVCLAYCLAASVEERSIAEQEYAKLNAEELEVAKQWKDILASKRELARDQKNVGNWQAALEERELEEYLEGEELHMQRREESCIIGDVIFLLDSSGSIKIENWKFVLDFVNEAISRMAVGPQATRVGLATFGNRAHLIFNLNNFTSADQMKPVVSAAKFLDENTNTSGGIWMAAKQMLTEANGARPKAPDMIIIITDGVSTYDHDKTIPYANEAKASGMLLISIGVGNETSIDELNGMASKGGDGKPLVFQVGSYAMLKEVQDTLATVACDPVATQGPTGPTAGPACDVPQTTTPYKECPGLSCKNKCPYGFAPDQDNCLTCGCLPKPFSPADCGTTTVKTE